MELRTGVCFDKRPSLAEVARFCFAVENSIRRRLPRLAENGLFLGHRKGVELTRALLSGAGSICFVRALQEAKAWRLKSSQPGCRLRRAAEDSN